MWSLAASGVNFAGSGGGAATSATTSPIAPQFINIADGDLDMKENKITNLSNPTDNNDATNKQYVDINKHNLSNNLILNNNQIWLRDNNTVRLQSLQDRALLVAPSGLVILSETTALLTVSTNSIFVNRKKVTSVADPTDTYDAANKKYVDSIKFTGDMNNKKITNLADPTDNNDGVNKKYVDNKKIRKDQLPNTFNSFALDGATITLRAIGDPAHYVRFDPGIDGIMLGGWNGMAVNASNGGDTRIFTVNKSIINAHNKKITNLSDPTDNNDAANKKYVDENSKFAGDMENKKITNLANPTATKDGANKEYVDWAVTTRIRAEDVDMNNFRITNLRVSTVATDAARVDQLFTGDMFNKKITNLADPTDDQDAVTKKYVELLFINPKYNKINFLHKPTFWISSKYSSTSVKDITGNGLTIKGTITTELNFDKTNSLISKSSYGTTFTFFVKGKKTSNGRLFTSTSGNKLLGWWNNKMKCAWLEGNIYGVSDNQTTNDSEIHTYILVNDNDAKKFYEEKTLVISTNDGNDTWDGQVVIGRPEKYSDEVAEGQIYEVICFDKVLTETEIFYIYDQILA